MYRYVAMRLASVAKPDGRMESPVTISAPPAREHEGGDTEALAFEGRALQGIRERPALRRRRRGERGRVERIGPGHQDKRFSRSVSWGFVRGSWRVTHAFSQSLLMEKSSA
jgi:hypothetical protein